MSLPDGTVTFLFTDIEGSTRLWEQAPETMQGALARHDAILREAIEKNNGYVVKSTGDGFFAAFHTAPEALAAALELQRTLSLEDWTVETQLKVRATLHTGTAQLRDNDYFGTTLSRATRLLAMGHGGQTLLSAATQELVRDALPPNVELLALGQYPLKDMRLPETVYQLLHPDCVQKFPPLLSRDDLTPLHNLPHQTTSFIGREREIQQIKELLKKTRLLTLIGSGGNGKTRLSLQIAAEMLEEAGDGVWFVELAPLVDAALVPQTVANVLGVKEEIGRPILQTLVEYLKSKRMMILLDNCEHLVNAAAQIADIFLKQCPHITLLATSREALNIAGETQYRLSPLSLPGKNQPRTVESLSQYEAVRLFIERALQAQTSFTVTNENAPALAQLCIQLDGIPLAIELAAARVRSLSVEEINGKLDNRFRLLTGGSRAALPRQQTLRALIDWSYDLLNEQEKGLLCRLSVFAGEWVLEAAEQVGVLESSEDGVEEWEIFDLLTSLVDKSLVVLDTGTPTRYRLLETMRQYAVEKLRERGEAEAARNRHLAFYIALMTEAKPKMTGRDALLWFDRLEAEQDNLRAALAWATEIPGGTEGGLHIAAVMERFWRVRGPLSEGRAILAQMIAKTDASVPSVALANALNAAGILAQFQNDDTEALTQYERAKTLWEELGDLHGVASTLNNLGMIASHLGDWEHSKRVTEEALQINRRIGSRQSEAINLNNLGLVAIYQRDYEAAQSLLKDALEINREIGMREWETGNLLNLGKATLLQGEQRKAIEWLTEALRLSQTLGYKILIAETMEAFAALAAQQAKWDRAAQIWGASEALREIIAAPMPSDEQEEYDHAISALRESTDAEVLATRWKAGRALTMEQAIELALDQVSLQRNL